MPVHPTLPCPPGQPAAFPSPPVALRCSELHGPPHPGQPGRSMNGESLTNAKKRLWGPPLPPLAAPCSRRTGHPPCPRGVPTQALLRAEPPALARK